MRRRLSKVRAWAEAQSRKKQEENPLKILSDSLIYALSQFCANWEDDKKEDKNLKRIKEKAIKDFSGDSTLFEIGCYLYFRIDLWHVKNEMQEFREKTVGFLINQFLTVFSGSLNLKDNEDILQNRLNLYGKLVRECENPQDEIDFYLNQLVIRTANNTVLKIYNFADDFPVIIIGIIEETILKAIIKSFNDVMIPICLKNVEKFYEMLSKDG